MVLSAGLDFDIQGAKDLVQQGKEIADTVGGYLEGIDVTAVIKNNAVAAVLAVIAVVLVAKLLKGAIKTILCAVVLCVLLGYMYKSGMLDIIIQWIMNVA